ncbi:MAG TPA: phosphotransferase [Baekduia sp.]|nr:phosphotransferase [Baekduia sp.]
MAQTLRLPARVEDLTAAWLSEVLGREVAEVAVPEVVLGTATKVRLELTYADDAAVAPPRELCAKGGLDERLAGWGLGPAYVLEARFFADVAPHLGTGVPRCWFAGVDDGAGTGLVLLDDLAASGCAFGDPTCPWSADLVAAALELLAGWHARTGAPGAPRPAWLTAGAAAVRGTARTFLTREHWEPHFAQEGAPVLPARLQDPERLLRAFEHLWALDDAAAHCVVHGDAHVGNTFVTADGRPGFLDWQTACLGPWSADVAYFVGGALTVEDRRVHERDLLHGYLEALSAHGGPQVSRDEAWADYVRHALHGVLWAATPAVMQPLERIVAMAQRYAAAIEDLEVLDALSA